MTIEEIVEVIEAAKNEADIKDVLSKLTPFQKEELRTELHSRAREMRPGESTQDDLVGTPSGNRAFALEQIENEAPGYRS
jgi:hypothetical protein